ncbi:hypothetical protein BD309DRAFT_972458 [Dichomitus squalens]|nr:hypothetical protein BD309DRAFT_972458 [Dichomitus squalens]
MLLNFDVLGLICSSLTERPDVLSFSVTCSTLHPLAVEVALSMGPIVIYSEHTVQKLHAFVFADPARRAPHIHALDVSARVSSLPIPSREFMAVITGQFVALLEHTTTLRWLQLAINEQYFLRDPSVLSAIARLRGLRTLSLRSIHSDAPSWIRTIQSSLRTLSIADLPGGFWTPASVTTCMARFASTLEHLELAKLRTVRQPLPHIIPFTAVLSLVLDKMRELPELECLMRLFPNLVTLSCDARLDGYADQYFINTRERNLEVQERRSWRYLDWVACRTETLYGLGLKCPVRHLVVDNSPARLWNDLLADSLFQNAPVHLGLSMNVQEFALEGTTQLQEIFPREGSISHLSHLVLFVPYDTSLLSAQGRTLQDIWYLLVETLLSEFQHLRLTHLRLVLRIAVSPNALDEHVAQFQYSASVLDLDPSAMSLTHAVQSLRYLFLALGVLFPGHYWHADRRFAEGERWALSKAWKSSNGVGDWPWQELSRGLSQHIINEEELTLSEEDEAWLRSSERSRAQGSGSQSRAANDAER